MDQNILEFPTLLYLLQKMNLIFGEFTLLYPFYIFCWVGGGSQGKNEANVLGFATFLIGGVPVISWIAHWQNLHTQKCRYVYMYALFHPNFSAVQLITKYGGSTCTFIHIINLLKAFQWGLWNPFFTNHRPSTQCMYHVFKSMEVSKHERNVCLKWDTYRYFCSFYFLISTIENYFSRGSVSDWK